MTFSIDSDKVETDNALINIDSNSHTQFKDKRGNALIEFATDINFKDTAGNFHDIGVKNMYMDDIDGTMVDHVNASDAHHIKYTDSEAIDAINNDTDHSSTASHSHTHLSDIGSDDHHTRYSDSEAISAVEGQSNLQLSGDLTVAGTITENNSI